MKVSRFEDLIAWQKAREFTADVYRTTRTGSLQGDRALAVQMQRAAVSIMSNIAEGFERSNQGDYHRFLIIAKASCGEVRSQLYVALDVGYITEADFNRLTSRSMEVSRVLGGLIRSVAAQRSEARNSRSTPPES